MNRKEYMKNYRETHKIEIAKKTNIWRKKNEVKYKKFQLKYHKIYRETHKNIAKKYQRKYYLENKIKILKNNEIYQKNHSKEIREYCRIYKNNKRKISINFKLSSNLRHRIYMVLKNNTKSLSTMKLVGCSIEFLKNYIESQFTKGMNWSNYGKWHVDHIKPCASFDLSIASEQRRCFHYTNLQPLWATDNESKGANIQ